MKRTLALILALVMVLPVSFISALAHGPGVGKNNITNQSIHNALNQPLPETVYVDGKYDDTAWDKDEWNSVTKRTGTWDSNAPTDVNFSYKYQIKMDSEYLYGVFSVGSGASEIKIWLNDDADVKKATDTIVITDLNNSMPTITINGAAPDKDKGTDGKYNAQKYQIKSAVDTVENNGNRVIEFRVYRKNFAGIDKVTYFTAVKKGNNSLYYPVIATNGNETLATPDVKWPANAIVVTRRDILDVNSDKHLPINDSNYNNQSVESHFEINVDGKLTESLWMFLSDVREQDMTAHEYFDAGKQGLTSPIDLTLGSGNSGTGVSTIHGNAETTHTHTYNGVTYDCGYGDNVNKNQGVIRFKYDIRTDGTFVYGAVVVYDVRGVTAHNVPEGYDLSQSYYSSGYNAAYVDTTFLNLKIYSGDTNWRTFEIKNSDRLGSTVASHNGNWGDVKEIGVNSVNENGTKIGCIRTSDQIVTYEFVIHAKDIFGDSTPADGKELTETIGFELEAFEGQSIRTDAYDGYAWDYAPYAACEKFVLNKKTHPDQDVYQAGLNMNGFIEGNEWNNLNAADKFVDGATKYNKNNEGKVTVYNNGIVNSYLYDVVADNDYIYGASLILLDDKVKYSDDKSKATAFRLFLNDKGENAKWTSIVSFYMGTNKDTRVYLQNADSSDPQNFTYTKNGKYFIGDNGSTKYNEYGLQAEIKILSTSDLVAGYKDKNPAMYNAIAAGKVAVVEYRIPYTLVGGEMPKHEEGNEKCSFSYYTMVEDGFNTGNGLVHPMPDNALFYENLYVYTDGNGTKHYSDFYIYKTFDHSANGTWNKRPVSVYSSEVLDTFKLDGMRTEFFWNSYEDYIGVNGSTGYYNPPQESNNTYAYGQTIYVGRNNIYGSVILDDEAIPGESEYTLWINSNPADKDGGYTHAFYFTATEDGIEVVGRYANGNVITSNDYVVARAVGATINGRTSLEFVIDIRSFDSDRSGFEYVTSSRHEVNGETLYLYYPAPDAKDKLFVTHINETTYLQHREGSIYTYEHTLNNPDWVDGETYRVPNGYAASYYIFAPTDVKNVYEVTYAIKGRYHPVTPATNGKSVKDALKKELGEDEFVYAIYDTSYDGTSTAKKTAFGKGYVVDCDEQFTVGAKVTFYGLGDLETTVDPDDAFKDSEYGYELLAQEVYFSVAMTDSNDRNANFPDNAWYKTALSVDTLSYFYPEIITIDGEIDDSGWDDSNWTEVKIGVNGTLQSEDYEQYHASGYDYRYQMRTDGENVYFAFQVMRSFDDLYTGATDNQTGLSIAAISATRVWIKSKADYYKGAVSFTHLYDVRYGLDSSVIGEYKDGWFYEETTLDIGPEDLAIHGQQHAGYDYYKSEAKIPEGENGVITYSDGKLKYEQTQVRFAEHEGPGGKGFLVPYGGNPSRSAATTTNKNYGDSLLFGETKENMQNLTTGAHGDEKTWYAYTDTVNHEIGHEHARWAKQKDGSTLVEFKFNLTELGYSDEDIKNGKATFEYIVQGSSSGSSTTAPFTMFNPPLTHIPYADERSSSNYSFPYWNWDENTSLKYNASSEYSHMLRNNYRPAVTLGAKVTDPDENGKLSIRFGGRYTEEYIRRLLWGATNMGDDGYIRDGEELSYDNGNGQGADSSDRVLGGANMDGITDYWDVSKVGIVFYFTQKLNVNSENQPELYIDTPNAVNVDSVGIYNWKQVNGENPNFADYEDYIFYVTLENMAPAYKNVKYSFRSYVTYYEWWDNAFDGSPAVYDQIIERSWQQVKDASESGINGFPQYDEDYEEPGNGNPGFEPGGSDEPQVKDYNGKTIAYIPLDNRPVNIDRAIYLAQSTGFNILMPPEELYTTKINSLDVAGDESAVGDPQALFQWLKDNENNADYFVISLDQLLSGGLVGSRDYAGINNLNESGAVYDPDLVFEETVIGYLADLVKEKDVVFFDSQMRLASTGDFNGYDTDPHYYFFRYCYAMLERPEIDVTQADALNKIFANYGKDKYGNDIVNNSNTNGNNVTLPDYRSDPNSPYYESWAANTEYTVDKSYIERYLKSRERKMKISEMLFDYGVVKNSKLFYVGIDDSNPLSTIHSNETRWLNYKGKGLKNFSVFSGIDEIGLMSLSAFVTSCYAGFDELEAVVNYYGPGRGYDADAYGTETLEQSINVHLTGVGTRVVSYTNTKNHLNVLVLTKSSTATDIENLIKKARENIEAGIPTAIIDASDKKGQLGEALVNSDIELSKLLGYSNWNTVANAAGLSISPAVARYAYLKNSNVITEASHVGALKQISYSFIKDVAYTYKFKSVGLDSDTEANRIARAKADGSFNTWRDKIVTRINGSDGQTITAASVMTAVGEYGEVGQIKVVGDLYWPWNRAFEASFDLGVKGTTNWAQNVNGGVVTLPELAADAPAAEADRYHATLNDNVMSGELLHWSTDQDKINRNNNWWSTVHYKKKYDESAEPYTRVQIDFTDGNGNAVEHEIGFLVASALKKTNDGAKLPDAIKIYALVDGEYVHIGEFSYNDNNLADNQRHYLTASVDYTVTSSIYVDIYGYGNRLINEIQVW